MESEKGLGEKRNQINKNHALKSEGPAKFGSTENHPKGRTDGSQIKRDWRQGLDKSSLDNPTLKTQAQALVML